MPSETFASLRGRIGAFRMHATHDPRETTANARAAFLATFYEGIPADLPEAERERRALAARKAHFARLAYSSAIARAAKKGTVVGRDDALGEVDDVPSITTTGRR